MGTILLIDGENFKGKIKSVFLSAGKSRPVWHEYNFQGLLDKVLEGFEINRRLVYFARIKEHDDSKEKSKQLIEEQRLLKTHLENQGFEVVLSGRVRGQMEDGPKGKKVLVFKEKGVDVKIAVDMVTCACDKTFDQIILGSSDSDLQPAIHKAREKGLKVIYVGFESSPNIGLTKTTDSFILVKNSQILECAETILNSA